MKVLHVYRTYFPDSQGGLEEAIRQICITTKENGVESRVMTLSRNPQPLVVHRPEADVYRAKLDIELLSCGLGFDAIELFRAQAEWADIIHYHFPWPFADGLELLVNPQKPKIVTYHSDVVRQKIMLKFYRPLMNLFLSRASVVVATSPNYLASSSILNHYREKTIVIPLGLDENSYPVDAADAHAALPSEPYFVFVGVLRAYKGLRYLIEAMVGASYKLVIVGVGPMEMPLRQQVKRLGLSNVTFAGYVDDAAKITLIKNCLGLVLPSHLRSEAFGISLVEGAMLAKPLISVEVGSGTSFVNVDGETGIVVPPSNSEKLRQAMDLICGDRIGSAAMGVAARRRYDLLFNGRLLGDDYLRLYQSLTPSIVTTS